MRKLGKIKFKALKISETLANRIGRGLLAGLAGTAAISISQMIDMKISKREASTTPAEVVDKLFGSEQKSLEHKKKLTGVVHWLYGTSWGFLRPVLSFIGLRKKLGAFIEFAAITSTAFKMLPSFKVAPPAKEWERKEIIKEVIHHAVYAIVSGVVYDLIPRKKPAV